MPRIALILNILLTAYLFTLLFSNISLTGYTSDIVVSTSLTVVALTSVFLCKTDESWISSTLRVLVCASAIQMGTLIGLQAKNPLSAETYTMKSQARVSVNKRNFNVYYKAGDTYGSGYGWLWISESPRQFPLIEKMKYYNPAIDYNFSAAGFSDPATQSLIRDIISTEIINKNK